MSEQKIYVVPAVPGMKVPTDDGRVLKAEGEFVAHNKWWRRRLTHGDVKRGVPPTEPTKKTPKAEAGKTGDVT